MQNAAALLFCPAGHEDAFSPKAWVGAMLRFEKALLQAQSDLDLMPNEISASVLQGWDAIHFDEVDLSIGARESASMAVSLVAALKGIITRQHGAQASKLIHVGATSQDVLDTAQCMLSQPVLAQVDTDAMALIRHLLALTRNHARSPMLARTLLQPASVTSFGFGCAGAAASIWRGLQRVRTAQAGALRLQLAGAVGTQAQLRMMAKDPMAAEGVRVRMAELLGLQPPAAWPTHTWRDDWLALATALAALCASVGKLGSDWALQAQFEVSEVDLTAEGRGASSAMPHKRNPVACITARGAAMACAASAGLMLTTAGQAHQRAHGEWQAELAEWPRLLLSTGAAVQAMACAAQHARPDEARMLANLLAVRQAVDADTADTWFDPLMANDAGEQAIALAARIQREIDL